ncbi:hypothetical protein CO657_03320 [Rhizobium acidisoli]|uniref:Uncharacterized protein n=1 Tax=Rhizobium acidisoli TaxID=1538158 RepID=A0AAE5WLV4_9HYPH|nr:hypothetical protein [Rhizobium acidisoli]KPH10191.1 hypothetical protein AOG23_01300 [Rhizobium acidisoli]QAS77180.1 hypothetical protein CO657_03320 [Rhizobium acidisoli]
MTFNLGILVVWYQRIEQRLSLNLQWWVWVPLSFSLGLIFSTGPLVQRYLLALATSDKTSIYGSSFQREVVTLPNLDDWFETAIAWPHPFIGLVVVVLAVRSSSIKQLFLRLSLFGFVTLMLFDLGYGLWNGALSVASAFENLVANFTGAIGVAAIAILLVELADYGFRSFEWATWPRRAVAGFLVMLGGTIALCVIFYVTDFFYRPRPATIDLLAESPSSGFIIAKAVPKSGRKLDTQNRAATPAFSMLSQVEESSSLNWRAPKNGKIEWSTNEDFTAYSIEVSLFAGCGPTDGVRKLPPSESPLKISDIRAFSLSHAWGAWDTTVTVSEGHGSAGLKGTDASFYSLDPSTDGKSIELQQIVADHSQATYSGGSDSIELFMITLPSKPEEAMESAPSLNFSVDGKEYVIGLSGSEGVLGISSEKIACRAVPTRQAFQSKVLDLGNSMLLGVKVVVSPKRKSDGVPNNVVTLNGDSGWLRVKGIDPKTLNTGGARIDMISVSGNLKSAAINGSDQTLKTGDTVTAIGDSLNGSFVSGLLKVSGEADLLWVNNDRANQTKWESLPIENKLLALAFLGSVFVWIARRVSALVSKGESLAWLEDGAGLSP